MAFVQRGLGWSVWIDGLALLQAPALMRLLATSKSGFPARWEYPMLRLMPLPRVCPLAGRVRNLGTTELTASAHHNCRSSDDDDRRRAQNTAGSTGPRDWLAVGLCRRRGQMMRPLYRIGPTSWHQPGPLKHLGPSQSISSPAATF